MINIALLTNILSLFLSNLRKLNVNHRSQPTKAITNREGMRQSIHVTTNSPPMSPNQSSSIHVTLRYFMSPKQTRAAFLPAAPITPPPG